MSGGTGPLAPLDHDDTFWRLLDRLPVDEPKPKPKPRPERDGRAVCAECGARYLVPRTPALTRHERRRLARVAPDHLCGRCILKRAEKQALDVKERQLPPGDR